eukprot:1678539-Rhodomonas_salina.1
MPRSVDHDPSSAKIGAGRRGTVQGGRDEEFARCRKGGIENMSQIMGQSPLLLGFWEHVGCYRREISNFVSEWVSKAH